MIRLAAALLPLFAAVPHAAAAELDVVTAFDQRLLYQVFTSRRAEAHSLIADSTVLARIGDIDPELKAALPFGSAVVLYFAASGDLLAWSNESGVVELGYWELIGSDFNELCLRFGAFGLTSLCASPEVANSDWMTETTPGNPFNLVAGASVPAPLGEGELSLRGVAAHLP